MQSLHDLLVDKNFDPLVERLWFCRVRPLHRRYLGPARGHLDAIEVDGPALDFSWSVDGENWNRAPVTLDQSLISDEAGGGDGSNFTGAFLGMACQDISGQDCPADFDYFEYREL